MGKILANGVRFAKVFPCQNFALYGTYTQASFVYVLVLCNLSLINTRQDCGDAMCYCNVIHSTYVS